MRIWIKNARLVERDVVSAHQDIFIENGIIQYIGTGNKSFEADQIWDAPGLYVSPGWMDLGVQICDPGYEFREDIASATAAATAGGFTAIASFPNNLPPTHSKSEIQYILSKAAGKATRIYPIGAVSHDLAGKDLAELYDMHAAGAVAFSDGSRPIQDAGLLLRALQYAQAFDGLILNMPWHKSIAPGGQMNEGINSTMLGLKGIPTLAESLMVQRDLSLLEYSGGRLHLHLISSAESVALIRKAKKAGLKVTCSVAIANLCFNDEKLLDFDSNWKITPPLRTESDRLALIEGLQDGTVDIICSNHSPWDEENKNLEFPYAEFGINGLETLFSLCVEHLSKALSLPEIIEKIAFAPRNLLQIPAPQLKVGEKAEITLFQPEAHWTYGQTLSKSKNSPMLGKDLKGKVLGTIWS